MGNDPAANFRAANARFRHIHGFKPEHTVAFEDEEGVSEGADHGVVADAVNILKAGHSGHGDAQRSPVFAAEIAVHGERKNFAFRVWLRKAKSFYNALHFLSVTKQRQRVVILGVVERWIFGSFFGVATRLLYVDLLQFRESSRVGVIGAAGIIAFHDFRISFHGDTQHLLQFRAR